MDFFNIVNEHSHKDKRNKPKFTIKDIFREYWTDFLDYAKTNSLKIRDIVFKEVQKIINCGTAELGYSLFNCPTCENFYIVFHTCKSRFCNSCGVKYVKDRVNYFKSIIQDCKHRHLVFTIPKQLRYLFREDRQRISLIFEAVKLTLFDLFNEKGLIPGFLSVLHTYGRDIKWNPHIHVLLAEGGYNDELIFKILNYFSFDLLRKKYQFYLLSLLKEELGSSFDKLKNELYLKYPNGFYVRAKKKKHSNYLKDAEYILRYTGKPVIAQSRITNIDYGNDSITFKYRRHEDENEVIETLNIFDFIKLIIVHIHEFNFKTVRYYGFYSPASKVINSTTKPHDKIILTPCWRERIINDFKYDPLICEYCKSIMNLEYSYFPT